MLRLSHLPTRPSRANAKQGWRGIMNTKRERALHDVDLADRRGIEVGPLCLPLISKEASEVYYIDHCRTEELRGKYRGEPNVNASHIASVDFVWNDKDLVELLADKAPLDYVVASHVIEHVPDLIGWLKETHEALRDGGLLVMIVPDK